MRAVVTAEVNRAGRKQAAAKYVAVVNSIRTTPEATFQADNELTCRFETSIQQTPYDTNETVVGLELGIRTVLLSNKYHKPIVRYTRKGQPMLVPLPYCLRLYLLGCQVYRTFRVRFVRRNRPKTLTVSRSGIVL